MLDERAGAVLSSLRYYARYSSGFVGDNSTGFLNLEGNEGKQVLVLFKSLKRLKASHRELTSAAAFLLISLSLHPRTFFSLLSMTISA